MERLVDFPMREKHHLPTQTKKILKQKKYCQQKSGIHTRSIRNLRDKTIETMHNNFWYFFLFSPQKPVRNKPPENPPDSTLS